MASNASMAERRAAAINRINRIAVHSGASQQHAPPKDPEMAHVIHLENAAAAMEMMAANQGLRISEEPQPGVPKDHRRIPGTAINEYIAPKETPEQASKRQTESVQQQTTPLPRDVAERHAEEIAGAGAEGETSGAAADADTAADDETDQSDEAKARRARRTEHRTTKK